MAMVFSKREQAILYITVCVVVFGLAFSFVAAPLWSANENLNKEIAAARAKIRRYASLLSRKEMIKKASSRFSPGSAMAGREGNTLIAVLSELEALAKDAGISIVDIAPQPARDQAARDKEIFIDLKTEGPIEGYLKFIYSTEKSLFLLRVKSFQLNVKPNSQLLEGNFSISHLAL